MPPCRKGECGKEMRGRHTNESSTRGSFFSSQKEKLEQTLAHNPPRGFGGGRKKGGKEEASFSPPSLQQMQFILTKTAAAGLSLTESYFCSARERESKI